MDKVLLVEDEEMIMKNMEFMIDWAQLGCVICATAANGREGETQILSCRPDIVITDIRMPFVDGIKMLENTRTQADYESIILSGYEDFTYAQKAIALGVSQYLIKPVDPQELEQAVAQTQKRLAERRRVRQLEEKANYTSSLTMIHMEETPTTTREEKMVSYICENFNKKISIQDLAEALELSVPYLHAKFKEYTGHTFNDFLNRYRVQQAVRFMQQTNMKIYEIAQSVGIPDYKYFNQVFKKYIGTSPRHFMRPKR